MNQSSLMKGKEESVFKVLKWANGIILSCKVIQKLKFVIFIYVVLFSHWKSILLAWKDSSQEDTSTLHLGVMRTFDCVEGEPVWALHSRQLYVRQMKDYLVSILLILLSCTHWMSHLESNLVAVVANYFFSEGESNFFRY